MNNSKEDLEIKMKNLKTLAEKMYGNSCYPIWINWEHYPCDIITHVDQARGDEITKTGKEFLEILMKNFNVKND